MPKPTDPIKQAKKHLNQLFEDRGQQLASVGGYSALPAFNANTGTWPKSGQHPRFLLHVRIHNNQVEVGYFPDSPLKGRIGWLNAVKAIPGVFVRLVLAFAKPDGTYELLTNWEWLVLILFKQAQIGATSAEALGNFFPPKPSVSIANLEVALASVELLGVRPVTETVTLTDTSGAPVTVSYEGAGEAIQRYLTFDYVTPLSDFPSTAPHPIAPPPPASPPASAIPLFPSL